MVVPVVFDYVPILVLYQRADKSVPHDFFILAPRPNKQQDGVPVRIRFNRDVVPLKFQRKAAGWRILFIQQLLEFVTYFHVGC